MVPVHAGEGADAVAADLWARLVSIFIVGPDGRRPCFGWVDRAQHDPNWKDNLMFHEYFHGDNAAGLGASHQTGWSALVAKLMQQYGAREERRVTRRGGGARERRSAS